MAIEEHVKNTEISKSPYTKEGITEELNKFRSRYNRYPTRGDFNEKKIAPSRHVFYRIFGSMDRAIKYARDLWIEERKEGCEEDTKRIKARTPMGFQCPFCGSYIHGVEEYYEALNRTLSMRFIGLLKNRQEGLGHLDAVVDSLRAIFGDNNDLVEDALVKNGPPEAYVRLKDGIKEVRDTCDHCGEKIKKNIRPFGSILTKILIVRFSELLRSENGKAYLDGILSSIHAAFGSKNPMMIKALDGEGFLDVFLKKFPNKTEESDLYFN